MQDVLASLAVDTDCIKNVSVKFNLNPLNFVTLASLSWECTSKLNKTELELLTDVDIMLDYKNSIRGVIARAICHYGKANNKYIHDYNEIKESIQYLNFNNQ